jgi:hypothetical protein
MSAVRRPGSAAYPRGPAAGERETSVKRRLSRAAQVLLLSVVLAVAAALVAVPAPAQGQSAGGPWDGTPISPGLGPTYGEPWCAEAAPGSSIANQQGSPLALIPQEAIGCTLEQVEQEAAAAGVPDRMEYSVVGQSAGGLDLYGVVVNALETRQQRRDYRRWQQIRAIEVSDPAGAQGLLASFGENVKMPIFVQANIHGNEEEGADAMMQVLRDLVTLPRGTSEIVDDILDHAILIVIPMENPDGRLAGTRANGNGFDMNRDWLVQSQSEVRTSVALQQQWLATVGLDLHGYVNPTLVDGLTKPHNPGIEYDRFLYWNQRRLDANEAALAAVGMDITRPVNDWNQAGVPPGNPAIAEGWDDWGPFYTQTYMAFYGVDSSTVEMCSSGVGCNGRLGSKTSQYVTFYSSADYWLANRQALMNDQLEVFRRGVADQSRPNCCDDPEIASRGFTEDQHNWMVEYPAAYVIPQNGGGQRSDAEANRMVQWLLDNGIEVSRLTRRFSWEGTRYPTGSYVVWMDQALRGLALTALSAGQDISNRILQLYAPPGAWSHGLLWGADVVEVSRGDQTFSPTTELITVPNQLTGGIRGGPRRPSDWYAVTLRGVSEYRVVLELLRGGVDGEVAEESFQSTTGGTMPAGTLIFPADRATRAALDAAGSEAGITFERNVGVAEPPTTQLSEAPKVAILVNSATPGRTDTSESLRAIFGPDVGFVSVSSGPDSLQNAPTDPLLNFDVIYNTGQNWPSNSTAQQRLSAFFQRGGGYIATGVSANNFAFLTGGGLVQGSLTQASQLANGGIAVWNNVGGAGSAVSGAFPGQDFLYLPSNVTYFSTTPNGSTIAGRYHEDMVGAPPNGPSPGFVAGHWRNRLPDANDAPVIVHGPTTVDSRYLGFAANPFSRQDAEREWSLIAQTALWSNLTDEGPTAAAAAASDFTPFYPGVEFTRDIPVPPGEKP